MSRTFGSDYYRSPSNKDYGSSDEFNITSIMAHCLACVYQIDQPSYLFKAPFPVAICLEV